MRLLCLILSFLVLPSALDAVPADLQGWRGARWGMTADQLTEIFGSDLKHLPGRWDLGSAYADKALFEAEVGGLGFTVFFQMNKQNHRLQQVLLERRANQVTPKVYDAVLAALAEAYGPPEQHCIERHPDGPPRRLSLRWRFPTTTLQVTWLDFLTTSALFEDPNRDRDLLVPFAKTRRINRRFLPRRLLIRFHPSDRRDLSLWRTCDP